MEEVKKTVSKPDDSKKVDVSTEEYNLFAFLAHAKQEAESFNRSLQQRAEGDYNKLEKKVKKLNGKKAKFSKSLYDNKTGSIFKLVKGYAIHPEIFKAMPKDWDSKFFE